MWRAFKVSEGHDFSRAVKVGTETFLLPKASAEPKGGAQKRPSPAKAAFFVYV